MGLKKPIKQAVLSAAIGTVAIAAANFIAPFEGTKYVAYQDGAGIWTICEGHTVGVKKGDTATPQQCKIWLQEDVANAKAYYERFVHRTVPANVEVAGISFIFNVGAGKFQTSTMLKRLNAGDITGSCHQFERWINQRVPEGSPADLRDGKKDGFADCSIKENAKVCGGLYTRRQQEMAMCLDPAVYARYVVTPDGTFKGLRK